MHVRSVKFAFVKEELGLVWISPPKWAITDRLGCLLAHTPVRDGAAKGKIERFFRTAREQFLSLKLDLSSSESLNRQFTLWVEEQYNAQLHSVLGMSPLDRFALDRNRIHFLPPNEANDELFFFEEDRHVRADNTFSFQAVRFEAPRTPITIPCASSVKPSKSSSKAMTTTASVSWSRKPSAFIAPAKCSCRSLMTPT